MDPKDEEVAAKLVENVHYIHSKMRNTDFKLMVILPLRVMKMMTQTLMMIVAIGTMIDVTLIIMIDVKTKA